MDFNAAAENDKFVKFTDLLHPWMQAYVNPFLESLIGEGKVDEAQTLGTAMVTAFGELPETLMKAATKKGAKAYVDVKEDFDFSDIWNHVIIPANSPIIARAVKYLASIAEEIETGQKEKFLKGFEEIVAAAPKADVTSPESTAKDFVAVFREKNPFKVQDMRRKNIPLINFLTPQPLP